MKIPGNKIAVVYHGGEFDPQYPQVDAFVISVDEETENANLILVSNDGSTDLRTNVPHEKNKIKSRNKKEETYHPFFVVAKTASKGNGKELTEANEKITALESRLAIANETIATLEAKVKELTPATPAQ